MEGTLSFYLLVVLVHIKQAVFFTPHKVQPDAGQKYYTSFVMPHSWKGTALVKIPASIIGACTYVYNLCISWSKSKKSSASLDEWRVDDWDSFLKSKFGCADYQQYCKNAITYCQGYLYEAFCHIVSELECEDSYFYELELFLKEYETGVGCDTALMKFFMTLSREQQGVVVHHVRLVVESRKKRAERFVLEWQEFDAKKSMVCQVMKELLCFKSTDEIPQALPPYYKEKRLRLMLNVTQHFSSYQETYELSTDAQKLLISNQLVLNHYLAFKGILPQHIVHAEMIYLIEMITKKSECNKQLLHSIEQARMYNVACQLKKAVRILNGVWREITPLC